MDDERLIAAVARGDHMALREIFDRHSAWIAGRLRGTLPADAVEDVLQETFIAVWQSAGRYSGSGAVGGWIWGIARRQAALWIRRHRGFDLDIEQLPIVDVTPDPAEATAARIDVELALSEIGASGSPSRELARLAFVEEQPVKEIARRLKIPGGTVKSRIHTLRRRLRTILTRGQP